MPALNPLLVTESGQLISSRYDWLHHRTSVRDRWLKVVGIPPRRRVPLDAVELDREELPGFTRTLVRYRTDIREQTEAYLLTPKPDAGVAGSGALVRAGRRPGIVVFHHTASTHIQQSAGVDRSRPELMIGEFLVRRGFVVLCPRAYLFDFDPKDIRMAVEKPGRPADRAYWTALIARVLLNREKLGKAHPEWTGMAGIVLDGLRAADYLASCRQVDPGRLGAIGHSLGAKATLYSTAFDERYKAAVFSEGGIGVRLSNWDADWYLGADWGGVPEGMDHHELLALIAPRPFMFISGDSEDDERSGAFVASARDVYRLFDADDRLVWYRHRAGHRVPPRTRAAAENFLMKYLA